MFEISIFVGNNKEILDIATMGAKIYANFETDENMLMVEYLKDVNKIWRLMYVDKESSTIKNIANKTLLKKDDKLHTGILTYLDNAEVQRDLLKATIK